MATRVMRRSRLARFRWNDDEKRHLYNNEDRGHDRLRHSSSSLMSNMTAVDNAVANPGDSLVSLQTTYNQQRVVLIVVSVLLGCCLVVACIGVILMSLRLRWLRRRDHEHEQAGQAATKDVFDANPEDRSPIIKDVIDIRPEHELPTIPYHNASVGHYRPALAQVTEFTVASAISDDSSPRSKKTSKSLQTWRSSGSSSDGRGYAYGPRSPGGFPARRALPHPELKLTIATPSPKGSPTMTAVNSDSPDTALRPSARSLAPFAHSRLSVPVTAVPASSYSSMTASPLRSRSPYPLVVDFLDKLGLAQYKAAFSEQTTLEALRDAESTRLCASIPGMSSEEADALCRAAQEELSWIDRRVSESSLDETAYPVVLHLS